MTINPIARSSSKLLYPLPSCVWELDVVHLARYLLGKRLIRILNHELLDLMIVETEAYHQSEPSCHAFNGKTNRNAPLFSAPGFSYVYFTYGMYHCLNVTAEPEGIGAAVLVRALESVSPLCSTRTFSGPGLICKHLNLNRHQHNLIDLKVPNCNLWLGNGEEMNAEEIVSTGRIGIKVAKELHWRFYLKGSPAVSKINKTRAE